MLKALLQGKPFGHPLHPALVHFPIGLLILSLLLDIAARLWTDQEGLYQAAFYTMAFGTVAGALAAIAGFADWTDIRRDHPAKKTATTHMLLNLTALALFGINLFLRSRQPGLAGTSLVYLGLSLAGVGIILVSGYLGGKMVYEDGIGAGRHRRHTPTPTETIRVSGRDAQEGWAPVYDAEAMKDGETLRVDYDGKIIAIAKQGGEVYAFQEFCTHRYGPLSEGKICDHQVECPWHRSRFDIRSGKVVEGPAKVDMKTYKVAIREGKIFIR
ncbi:MAG: DUF2231 domain-containing protein [Chloroflexota bacterium]|nr:MAG: DUF2231 domain-containing protein [Chloroflexota bacterium]